MSPAQPGPRHDAPVVERHVDAQGLRLVLELPADLGWFDGHFPGHPILPGVVQLRWAIEAARQLPGLALGPTAIQQLKFKRPMVPGDRIELRLAPVARGAVFRYLSAAGEHSSGRLVGATGP